VNLGSVCLELEPVNMTAGNDGPPVLGIDLGGTKILVGVVSGSHRILGRAKRTTPAKDGGNAIVAAIMACVQDAIESADLPRSEIVAVGIGSPGPLDPKTGTILFSANLNMRDFPLGAQLSAAIGRPVLVRNDVRAAGIGEFRLGIGRGHRDVIAAFVGTGIGGCIIRGGQIVEGSTGNAGEIGHMIIKAGGPRCGCGSRGCMEALASKTAIARRLDKAIRNGFPTVLADKMTRKGGRLKSGDLAEAVAAKDLVALKEVQRAAHFLGVGLGSLINALGPELLIIGGGVAGALGEPYLELVRSATRSHAITDPEGKVRIELGALGDDAGILGAALLAREHFGNR
jgi:glucokinase